MGTLEYIAQGLAASTTPFREAVSDPASFRQFMYRLGWRTTDLPPSWAALADRVDDIVAGGQALAAGPDIEKAKALLQQVKGLHGLLGNMTEAPVPAGIAADFLKESAERIFELLLVE